LDIHLWEMMVFSLFFLVFLDYQNLDISTFIFPGPAEPELWRSEYLTVANQFLVCGAGTAAGDIQAYESGGAY